MCYISQIPKIYATKLLCKIEYATEIEVEDADPVPPTPDHDSPALSDNILRPVEAGEPACV